MKHSPYVMVGCRKRIVLLTKCHQQKTRYTYSEIPSLSLVSVWAAIWSARSAIGPLPLAYWKKLGQDFKQRGLGLCCSMRMELILILKKTPHFGCFIGIWLGVVDSHRSIGCLMNLEGAALFGRTSSLLYLNLPKSVGGAGWHPQRLTETCSAFLEAILVDAALAKLENPYSLNLV
ncbi:hypothetical protein AZE99_03505 [Sphingorhabdus sp. M41]|nr:hypothetical protein AZE99_03505 [Sphingorhabdus sp. M41]